LDYQSLAKVIQRIRKGDRSVLDQFPPEERRVIQEILYEFRVEGRSRVLDAIWSADFKRRPVTIDQFLEDDYYLGKVGSSIFPKWRTELRYVHDPTNEFGEWIIRGCIGAGKTSVAVLSILYKIHYLLCMKDPQTYHGLAPQTPIVFGLFNIYKYLAKDTSYGYLTNWSKLSPFFQEVKRAAVETGCNCWRCRMQRQHQGHIDDLQSGYISFPNHITIALGSSAIHALGQNLFGGLLDEADMGRSKSVSDDERSQVADMYGQVRSRIDSRFLQSGKNPGFLCLVSQVRGKDSFLEQHVRRVANDPHTHVTQYALWEIKDFNFAGQKQFKVIVGDQRIRSSIPKNEAEIQEALDKNLRVIDVPESLRGRFEYSIEDAIRDLAGIPTFGTDIFLPRRDKLYECIAAATDREHPFTQEEVELSIEPGDNTMLEDFFDKTRCMVQRDKVSGSWEPRWYPGAPRAAHIDLAQKKDCAGLAMGCLGDVRAVLRYDRDGRPYRAVDYVLFIDFALRIRAVKGSEIDFAKIRQFLFYISDLGFPLSYVSYDGFESVDSRQIMSKAGFDVSLLSVDRKPDSYTSLRSVIYEGRFDMYEYEPFMFEVTRLVDKTLLKGSGPKIDHPRNGSKDVSDGVAGVNTRLMSLKEVLLPAPTERELQQRMSAHFKKQQTPIEERMLDPKEWINPKRIRGTNPLASIFGDIDE
jgi:hypothetical protein